jgi:hypothetical protein
MLKKLLVFAITSGFAAKVLQKVLERNQQRHVEIRDGSEGPGDPADPVTNAGGRSADVEELRPL